MPGSDSDPGASPGVLVKRADRFDKSAGRISGTFFRKKTKKKNFGLVFSECTDYILFETLAPMFRTNRKSVGTNTDSSGISNGPGMYVLRKSMERKTR